MSSVHQANMFARFSKTMIAENVRVGGDRDGH